MASLLHGVIGAAIAAPIMRFFGQEMDGGARAWA
jgi:hypothetical protein